MWLPQNSYDQKGFNKFVTNQLYNLAAQASEKKFAVKEGKFKGKTVVYSLAQCIPNISTKECNTCLRKAIGKFPIFCNGCVGARVLSHMCNIRFETYPFYNVGAHHDIKKNLIYLSAPEKKKV
jgi:hypothetical protein